MNASPRIARVLAGLLCFTVAGLLATELGLASAPMPELLAKARQLDALLEIEQRATKTKEGVAADVIAGRLTLVQAAARFSTADAELNPESLRARMDMIAGNSDSERQCRKVINYVERALADEPSESTLFVDRLTAELQHEMQQNGTVTLPDSAPVLH